MADPAPSPKSFQRDGIVRCRRGSVFFSICRYERYRKRKRFIVWWSWMGKRYSGVRPLPIWFPNEEEALRAVRSRWRPVRGGLTYPRKR